MNEPREDASIRYARQLSIPEIGHEGQTALANATVFIAGAGGLGSAVAYYLVAAGVGTVIVCDRDSVELSNLNRQILHGSSRIGVSKVTSAYETLSELNPSVTIIPQHIQLTHETIDSLAGKADILIDCLDNFEARLVLNDFCIKTGKALVYASIDGWSGQLTFLHPPHTPCLYCLFQGSSFHATIPALGATAGIIGSLQSLEVIKYLTHSGDNLLNTLLVFDGRMSSFRTVTIGKDPMCPQCARK
jgi:adenylyltransferase/sulfurtransferase